ncbi:hypothetical protein H6G64_12360 [Calothrix sp. FACHB-156]|nr:hypothetical protein [Calothrix sp. FACHB-156]
MVVSSCKKKNHKINPRVSEIVRIVFDFHNYEYQDSQKAVIKKPAKVSSFTNGEGWILEEQGLIDFSGSSLLEISSENNKFIQDKYPDIINDKLEEENSFLWLTRAEFDDYIHQFGEELIRLKLQVKQITNSQQEMQLELKSINDLHSSLVTE